MAMENKRIIQLNTERTTPAADDYVMVDSATAGTAKYLLPKITDAIDQEISDRTSADTTLQTAITNEATARTNADTTLQGNITTEATARAAADTAINGEITQLKEDYSELNERLSNVIDFYGEFEPYLYKKNTYINNGVETTLNGYDLYKIPVSAGDMIYIQQTDASENFWGGVAVTYVLNFVDNGSYTAVTAGGTPSSHPTYNFKNNASPITRNYFMAFIEDGVTAVMVSIKQGNEKKAKLTLNTYSFSINDNYAIKNNNTVYDITESNSVVGNSYPSPSNGITDIFTSGYSIRSVELKQGDKVHVSAKATGINYWGYFINGTTLAAVQITQDYTAPADGYLFTFHYSGDTGKKVTVTPADSFAVDWTQLRNIPDSDNPYVGLNGVAFGTSITYRAISSYGYLQYLPNLAEMTFDNQGIGSSTILGNMLTAIKAYTNYSNKNVCILEGFVNDWYQGLTLGTYEDTTETTVCGCVRSALDYMLSQNANMTIFLVLDHYGKLYGGVDCRSTAENSNGVTQYEFYEEIAKVAQSLAIPVIKLYADSQIGQNTPQYLNDNIHPTALGAKQDAYTIWAGMKQHYPNQVN